MTARKLLIEGRPGIGKTTLVERVVERLLEANLSVAGFTTGEMRIEGRRVGFRIDAVDGQSAVLAHVDLPGPPRVGRYGVDVSTFERTAIPALEQPGDVIVIDELGKMELASATFVDIVRRLLEGDRPLLATIHAHRHPVTDRMKNHPSVEVLHISASNRDRLVEDVGDRLLRDVRSSGG
jgi:nucleoside-triphosphatase